MNDAISFPVVLALLFRRWCFKPLANKPKEIKSWINNIIYNRKMLDQRAFLYLNDFPLVEMSDFIH